jgi:molybdate-binding protein
LVYADDDVLLDETINNAQKGMETLLVSSWEDCLAVNADTTTA